MLLAQVKKFHTAKIYKILTVGLEAVEMAPILQYLIFSLLKVGVKRSSCQVNNLSSYNLTGNVNAHK